MDAYLAISLEFLSDERKALFVRRRLIDGGGERDSQRERERERDYITRETRWIVALALAGRRRIYRQRYER